MSEEKVKNTKKIRKKVKPKFVKAPPPPKPEPQDPFEYLQADHEGMVSTENLMKWFHKIYPEAQRVDRKNGVAWHLDGRKVIKEPINENKGGLFFSGWLRDQMIPLCDEIYVKWHQPSKCYKVGQRIPQNVAHTISSIITHVHVPKHIG